MNYFDSFMGLIKETKIPLDTIRRIIINRYFNKFLHNIAQKSLRERKHFIARERLADL